MIAEERQHKLGSMPDRSLFGARQVRQTTARSFPSEDPVFF